MGRAGLGLRTGLAVEQQVEPMGTTTATTVQASAGTAMGPFLLDREFIIFIQDYANGSEKPWVGLWGRNIQRRVRGEHNPESFLLKARFKSVIRYGIPGLAKQAEKRTTV